jgi:hypothetical protein
MTAQTDHSNCVLLRDTADDIDAALVQHARSRCWVTEPATDTHDAFARLCLHERLQSSRAAWGLQRHLPPVLVIDADLDDTTRADLLGACDRYLPGIGVWHWRSGALCELRPAQPPGPADRDNGSPGPSAHAAPPARPSRLTINGPVLRLHEPPDDAPRTAPRTDPEAHDDDTESHPSRETALSPDEIHMLLGTDQEHSTP